VKAKLRPVPHAGTCFLLHGLRGSCVCTSRGKCWTFYPTAWCFSVLPLSKECQPYLPFPLSLSLCSFCSLWLTVPQPVPDTLARLWERCHHCSHHSCPGSVQLQSSPSPALVVGPSVPDYPAASPSAWLLWARVHPARQRLGAALQVPQYFVVSQASSPKPVAEPWCHPHATRPCVPHAHGWQASRRCWAMGQQLPNQAPSSPRYSRSPQLPSLGHPDPSCWRSFPFFSGRFPTERQCVLKS